AKLNHLCVANESRWLAVSFPVCGAAIHFHVIGSAPLISHVIGSSRTSAVDKQVDATFPMDAVKPISEGGLVFPVPGTGDQYRYSHCSPSVPATLNASLCAWYRSRVLL